MKWLSYHDAHYRKLPVLVINMENDILSEWEIHFEHPLLTPFGWPTMMGYNLLARTAVLSTTARATLQ